MFWGQNGQYWGQKGQKGQKFWTNETKNETSSNVENVYILLDINNLDFHVSVLLYLESTETTEGTEISRIHQQHTYLI